MAVGLPLKVTYADGDVYAASDVNDTNGTINAYVPTGPASGVNKIINADTRFNQRNFTSISGVADTYGFDRFKLVSSGGATWTPQTFTPGAAPIAGYDGVNYSEIVTAGQTGTTPYTLYNTTIEDVRVLAGQSVTLSYFAKSASGTPKIALEVIQAFGSGGSPSAAVFTYVSQTTISTSWTRYSVSFTMPSISGKTIGTTANTSLTAINLWISAGTDFNARTGSLGIQSNTFSIWGLQLQAGSTATAFQTATGTIQGELAACQRYYVRFASSDAYAAYAVGTASQTNTTDFVVNLPVTMRINPSAIDYSNIGTVDGANAILSGGTLAIPASTNGNDKPFVRYSKTGATQFRPYFLINNAGTGYIGFSAEL